MSDKLAVVKLAGHVVVSFGVWKVVSDVVKANTLAVTKTQQVQVAIGSFVLASMITDFAVNHVHTYMDQIVNWYQNREQSDETLEK
jgi:hypothetical protein